MYTRGSCSWLFHISTLCILILASACLATVTWCPLAVVGACSSLMLEIPADGCRPENSILRMYGGWLSATNVKLRGDGVRSGSYNPMLFFHVKVLCLISSVFYSIVLIMFYVSPFRMYWKITTLTRFYWVKAIYYFYNNSRTPTKQMLFRKSI